MSKDNNSFLKESYPFRFIGCHSNTYIYQFVSTGKKNVVKIVTISPVKYFDFGYNLGFGNLEYDKDNNVIINDRSVDNNKDWEKVLNTVFICIIDFLLKEPKAIIGFYGNTYHKQILYKRKITAFLPDLIKYFDVFGGFATYSLEKTEIKTNDSNVLVYKEPDDVHITNIEVFTPQKSKDYDFILINSKEN